MQPGASRSKVAFSFSLFAVFVAASLTAAEQLSESDKYFLAGYEEMRVALVANDLERANKAAQTLTDSGISVMKSETLDRARTAFAKVSEIAVKLATGRPGYYVMYCPMLKREWVQTSKEVANPYGGKEMVSCGEIKK